MNIQTITKTEPRAVKTASTVLSLDIAARVGAVCGPVDNIQMVGVYEELAVVRVLPHENPDPFLPIPLVEIEHTEAWNKLRAFYYQLLELLNSPARERKHQHQRTDKCLSEVLEAFDGLISPASSQLLELWLYTAMLGEPAQRR
jgi:hypothetical protein